MFLALFPPPCAFDVRAVRGSLPPPPALFFFPFRFVRMFQAPLVRGVPLCHLALPCLVFVLSCASSQPISSTVSLLHVPLDPSPCCRCALSFSSLRGCACVCVSRPFHVPRPVRRTHPPTPFIVALTVFCPSSVSSRHERYRLGTVDRSLCSLLLFLFPFLSFVCRQLEVLRVAEMEVEGLMCCAAAAVALPTHLLARGPAKPCLTGGNPCSAQVGSSFREDGMVDIDPATDMWHATREVWARRHGSTRWLPVLGKTSGSPSTCVCVCVRLVACAWPLAAPTVPSPPRAVTSFLSAALFKGGPVFLSLFDCCVSTKQSHVRRACAMGHRRRRSAASASPRHRNRRFWGEAARKACGAEGGSAAVPPANATAPKRRASVRGWPVQFCTARPVPRCQRFVPHPGGLHTSACSSCRPLARRPSFFSVSVTVPLPFHTCPHPVIDCRGGCAALGKVVHPQRRSALVTRRPERVRCGRGEDRWAGREWRGERRQGPTPASLSSV